MVTDSNYLIPTKTSLFGLDVRFRAVDKKLDEEKGKKFSVATKCV